jgi:superfamily I DNA/RNA helicase
MVDDFMQELLNAEHPPEPPPAATEADHKAHGGVGDRWVHGPPGTGKTTFLARQIEYDAKHRGSDKVVALSHTRAAAAEIALRRVPLPPDNIGTLHSLAYRALGRPKLVETQEGLAEFSKRHPAFQMSETYSVDDMEALIPSKAQGDNLLSEYSRYRNLEVPRELWPSTALQNFADLWEDYKQAEAGIDFTDMIQLAIRDTHGPECAPEVMIVDEGQDLSRLQFRLLTKWGQRVEKFILAFDADQSIYGFAGADPEVFLENEPTERKVLTQSHRIPARVHDLAMRWIRQTRRADIEYRPRTEEGQVEWLEHQWRRPESLLPQIEQELAADGRTMMIIASCGYMLDPLVRLLRLEGIPYHNPYRRKQGAWNPLRRPRNGVATHDRIADFLAPWSPGAERMWTSTQLVNWTAIVKDVFRRGKRELLEDLDRDAEEGEVIEAMIEAFAEEEELAACMAGPPLNLDWLEGHLRKDKEAPARYALTIARRLGEQGLRETPRLVVGTIHSVKGGEADSVYLFPDLSPEGYNRYAARSAGRDEVVRQFYVGMTRAKHKLALLTACGPGVEWGH